MSGREFFAEKIERSRAEVVVVFHRDPIDPVENILVGVGEKFVLGTLDVDL